jgi:hypothetical protein
MSEKRARRFLGLAVAMLVAWAGSADPIRAADTAGGQPGLWRKSNRDRAEPERSPELQRQIEQLEAIGYLDGTEAARDQPRITLHDSASVQPGPNLLVSGHAAAATLMDREGKILHRWRYAFEDIWPDREIPARQAYWRRAHLFENGDLLAIFEARGIVKLDAGSNLLWANPVSAHHDLEVLPDGRILVLTRRPYLVPEIHPERAVLEDFISILDADGQLIREVSILKAIIDSPFQEKFEASAGRKSGDVLHTNSLFVLDGRGSERAPWLAAGNILISMREPSLVAVVDLAAGKVVEMWSGDFRYQHDAKILENGNLLLFDNSGLGAASRVIEADPITRERRWSYEGSTGQPFYSQYVGAAQRLPNGNTLITESGEGRAFEVRPDKQLVWEYNSPHRAGENDEFVASLLEIIRLPADFPTAWPTPESKSRPGR